jgi:hypothetical protein
MSESKWAKELQDLAERQGRVPPMRRFKNHRLAGYVLLGVLLAAITGNAVVVIALTFLFCMLPIAKGRR